MLRASFGKVVHTVKRAGTYAAKVSPQELHKIAVHVRAETSAYFIFPVYILVGFLQNLDLS